MDSFISFAGINQVHDIIRYLIDNVKSNSITEFVLEDDIKKNQKTGRFTMRVAPNIATICLLEFCAPEDVDIGTVAKKDEILEVSLKLDWKVTPLLYTTIEIDYSSLELTDLIKQIKYNRLICANSRIITLHLQKTVMAHNRLIPVVQKLIDYVERSTHFRFLDITVIFEVDTVITSNKDIYSNVFHLFLIYRKANLVFFAQRKKKIAIECVSHIPGSYQADSNLLLVDQFHRAMTKAIRQNMRTSKDERKD